jgi:hypothetical protein
LQAHFPAVPFVSMQLRMKYALVAGFGKTSGKIKNTWQLGFIKKLQFCLTFYEVFKVL